MPAGREAMNATHPKRAGVAVFHALWARWPVVVWLASCLLGCAAPKAAPQGSSEYFQACQETCARDGRDVKGIVESATQVVCYCGKQLPIETMLRHNDYEVPRFIQRRPW